jgi:hypothetical protein
VARDAAMNLSDLSFEHQQAIQVMMPQLLIVLFNRLGGTVDIPVEEIDGTGKFNLAMSLNDRVFHFEVQQK